LKTTLVKRGHQPPSFCPAGHFEATIGAKGGETRLKLPIYFGPGNDGLDDPVEIVLECPTDSLKDVARIGVGLNSFLGTDFVAMSGGKTVENVLNELPNIREWTIESGKLPNGISFEELSWDRINQKGKPSHSVRIRRYRLQGMIFAITRLVNCYYPAPCKYDHRPVVEEIIR